MAKNIQFSIIALVAALTLISAAPPTCSKEKKIFVSHPKSLQKENGEIYCFYKEGQPKSDVCEHQSQIVYTSNQKLEYVELQETSFQSCIILTSLDIPVPEICLNYTAKASDENSENPATICVVFNPEGPNIPPDQSTLINMADGKKSRIVPIEMSSTDGISDITITDVSPKEFTNYIRVNSLDPESLNFTITETITTSTDIDVSMMVTDNGNPKLKSMATFRMHVINESITCDDMISIVNPSDSVGKNVGNASCSSKTGTLNFTITEGGVKFVRMDSVTGSLTLTFTKPSVGVYNLTVTVQSSSALTIQFKLQIQVGYPPIFTNTPYTLSVNDTTGPGVCFNDIISIDPTTPEKVIYRDIDNSVIFYFPYSNSTLCTKKDLFSENRKDYNVLYKFDGSNKFGSSESAITITIKVIKQIPVITFNTSTELEVSEITVLKTIITTLTIQPQRPVTEVKLTDQANLPFALQVGTPSGYEIIVKDELDANNTSFYLLSIKASNVDGISTATVNVTIMDNVAPSCEKNLLEPTVNRGVNEGHIVPVENQCSDVDGDAITFNFTSDTPSYITDHFSIVSNEFRITVKKQLTDLSVQELKSLKFTVDVSDSFNSQVQIEVNISIFVDAPTCDTNPAITVPETLGEGCVNISAFCNGTDGLRLEYSIPNFIATTLENGDIQICGDTALEVGTSQIKVVVDDEFNRLEKSTNLTITAVNKHQPVFANVGGETTIDLSENTTVGSEVFTFTVTDEDDGEFGKFTVTAVMEDFESGIFQVSDNNIILLKKLNASSTSVYTIFLTATDTGGLNANLTVVINVQDVNEPPVCIQPTTFNISVLMDEGEVGNLPCYDYDVSSDFKQISYNLIQPQSMSVPMEVDDEGTLKVTGSLLDKPETLEFTVEASTGDQTTSIKVTVYLSRMFPFLLTKLITSDFPPSCNATSIRTTFKEDSSGCSQEKIRCSNQVSSPMTLVITNDKTGDLDVQITNDTVEQLDIRVCLSQSGRQNLFTYTIGIRVENELGKVDINWEVNIEDINDAPYFKENRYTYQLNETTNKQTMVATISVFNEPDPTDPNIQLVDPDTLDKFNIKHISADGKVMDRVTKQEKAGAVLAISYDDKSFTVTSSLKPELYYQFDVQAEDGGKLTASSIVTFMVNDVNQAPTCDETNLQKNLSLLQGVSQIFISVDCSDTDFDENFNSLSYSLQTQTTDVFAISGNGNIYLNKKLPRGTSQHIINIIVKDGGGLTTSSTLTVNVNRDVGAECTPVISPPNVWLKDECISIESNCVDPTADETSTLSYETTGDYSPDFYVSDGLDGTNVEPSAPELSIGPVTTNSITILWSYTRPDAVSFIDRHIVEVKTVDSIYTVVQNSVTSYQFNNLQPQAVYSFRVIAETNNKNLTTIYKHITTRAIPILTNVLIGFKVLNRVWNDKMVNNQSQEYKQLKQETEENVRIYFSLSVLYCSQRKIRGDTSYCHIPHEEEERPGSVIFDGIMFVNQSGTVEDTSQTFLDQVYTGTLGNLTVQDGIVHQGDQYISSATLTLRDGDPDKLLEGTSIEYACKFRLVSVNGVTKPNVRWFLDDTLLIVTHTPRIKMRNSTDSNDRFGYQYIIQFDKAIPSHAGLLTCMVQSSSKSSINSSATEAVKIISKPVVTLWPLSTFLQDGDSVTLKCSSPISPVTYSWFDAQTGIEISSARNLDSYSVSIVDKDIQVYCKCENLAGMTQSPTATIHHTPSITDSLPCRSSTDARNTTWPPVKAGTRVKLTCGENYNGI
ncbi:hypothetical protein LOTGIDRAFT_154493 [Lottia gigantea]|uniref:Protein-tyrosine-phosphatase n=1 Tax=Lottia gigantea TaxID=225164 RepID=V3ZE56_LOTGI|nr:hypothetical protein LOTGIDRAFT_154493 [Lottia gigantea]ESO89383.1 hypothetical protein LOTGIDRAFT_154493 [Lottia gigantea]